MPNAAALEGESLSFRNYYNHTFATYMGIQGQLHSGYQRSNLDASSLPSIQSLLKAAGYRTCFVNTEPLNRDFSGYLEGLGFDDVLSDTSRLAGMGGSVSDADAYALLYDTALSMGGGGAPFFIAMYTFGTHASFDSVGAVFGGGEDPLLNKFHEADARLGEFLGRLRGGPLADSTVFVYTADHCTYADADFRRSFPGLARQSPICDEIPLMVYHAGWGPADLDAGGRNSLCLAPTLLDLLDVDGENFFLGNTLFGPEGRYDRCFQSLTTMLRTGPGSVSPLGVPSRLSFERDLARYFALKAMPF